MGSLALSSLSGTAPLQYNASTATFSITQSGISGNGYLASADFNTFNNKLSSTSLSSANGFLIYNSTTGVFTASTSPTYANATSTNLYANNLSLGNALPISSGGTGTSTAPAYGQLLLGDAGGNYELVSTSSLGITGGSGGRSFGYPFPSNATSTYLTLGGGVGIGASSTTLPLYIKNVAASSGSQFGTVFFGVNNTGDQDALNVRVKDGITDLAADYTGGIDTNLSSLLDARTNGGALTEGARL